MRARLLLLVLAAVCVGACARRAHRGEPDLTYVYAQDVPVEVENQHFLDVNVYVLAQGNRTRIGSATGSRTTTLMIPKAFLSGYAGTVQLAADPVGSTQGLVSEGFTLRPGDIVHWTIASNLAHSSVAIRQ